jgi:exodeoxyribonuclease VII large subunit
MLESVSYRAVLERGFALVKGADGILRRRAASLKTGEALRLTFADGEAEAVAGGSAKSKGSRARSSSGPAKGPQGDLF